MGTHQVASSDDTLAKVISEVLSQVTALVKEEQYELRALARAALQTAPSTSISYESDLANPPRDVCPSHKHSLVDGQLHTEAVPVRQQQDPGAVVPAHHMSGTAGGHIEVDSIISNKYKYHIRGQHDRQMLVEGI